MTRPANGAASSGPRRAWTSALLTLTVLLAACTGADVPAADGSGDAPGPSLAIRSANFDLAVGEDRRLLLAVFTHRGERVAGGTIEVRLAHLGAEQGGEAALGPPMTATFLPISGLDIPAPDPGPAVVGTDALTGVYRLDVDLDAPGFWGVSVTADLVGIGTLEGKTYFPVLEAPGIIDVGDPAPRTPNVVRADVAAGRAAPQALDSRLRSAEERDRAAVLHDTRVDDSVAAGRPVLIVISTPVYCMSLFCGPLTDYIVDVAERHGDRADFVHIEVWEDFEEERLNPAAAAWIQTESDGREPWVFLVDATGTVIARWDNVIDPDELDAALSALPVLDDA